MRRAISSSCRIRRSSTSTICGREAPALRAERDHSLDKTDALESVEAFYASIVNGTPRPEINWTFERDGSIKVIAKERPERGPDLAGVESDARNFRHDVIGDAYQSTTLTPSGPNTWVGRVPAPTKGWTAFFVEMTLPDRRQVSAESDHRSPRASGHAAVCGAETAKRRGCRRRPLRLRSSSISSSTAAPPAE